MDHMLYVSMSGAKQITLANDVNTNNLANASTSGFKADLAAFGSLPVYGDGYRSRVYTSANQSGANLSGGSIQATGNELDVAIDGEGWIAVSAPDGREAYTREGNLHVTENGQLVTGAGYPVMGNSGPISIPPYEKLDIGADGTISIRPVGQTAASLAVVDRIKLVKPDAGMLQKGEDSLMHAKDGTELAPDANVRLVSGAIESSNVNAVQAMVNMIELARQYEMNVKMMNIAKDLDESSTQVVRMG